jgi:uncharacterized protein YceK
MISAPHWLFPLIFALLLTGCSSLSKLTLPDTGETKLFAEGLDRYIATSDPTTLEQLPLLYPQGKWRGRAETILDMAETQLQLKALLDDKEQVIAEKELALEQCQTNQEFAICQAEKNALAQDNKMLEATLNQLKEVLIDTELKAK